MMALLFHDAAVADTPCADMILEEMDAAIIDADVATLSHAFYMLPLFSPPLR